MRTRCLTDRVKSLKAKDEDITPGILYVGVATMAGSIIARTRTLQSITPAYLFLKLNSLVFSFVSVHFVNHELLTNHPVSHTRHTTPSLFQSDV